MWCQPCDEQLQLVDPKCPLCRATLPRCDDTSRYTQCEALINLSTRALPPRQKAIVETELGWIYIIYSWDVQSRAAISYFTSAVETGKNRDAMMRLCEVYYKKRRWYESLQLLRRCAAEGDVVATLLAKVFDSHVALCAIIVCTPALRVLRALWTACRLPEVPAVLGSVTTFDALAAWVQLLMFYAVASFMLGVASTLFGKHSLLKRRAAIKASEETQANPPTSDTGRTAVDLQHTATILLSAATLTIHTALLIATDAVHTFRALLWLSKSEDTCSAPDHFHAMGYNFNYTTNPHVTFVEIVAGNPDYTGSRALAQAGWQDRIVVGLDRLAFLTLSYVLCFCYATLFAGVCMAALPKPARTERNGFNTNHQMAGVALATCSGLLVVYSTGDTIIFDLFGQYTTALAVTLAFLTNPTGIALQIERGRDRVLALCQKLLLPGGMKDLALAMLLKVGWSQVVAGAVIGAAVIVGLDDILI